MNSLPDARTRHNRNSKPSAGSYLRVRRDVDKEDFALNYAPLCGRGATSAAFRGEETSSFTVLKGLFPKRAQGTLATFHLSPVEYNNTFKLKCSGPLCVAWANERSIGTLGRDSISIGPLGILMIAKELDECQERHIRVPIDSASNAASWAEAAGWRARYSKSLAEMRNHNFALNSQLTVSP